MLAARSAGEREEVEKDMDEKKNKKKKNKKNVTTFICNKRTKQNPSKQPLKHKKS